MINDRNLRCRSYCEYSAPEFIVGQECGYGIDIWSVACITFELITGDLMFAPKADIVRGFEEEDDHLAKIRQICGKFSKIGRNFGRFTGFLIFIPRILK